MASDLTKKKETFFDRSSFSIVSLCLYILMPLFGMSAYWLELLFGPSRFHHSLHNKELLELDPRLLGTWGCNRSFNHWLCRVTDSWHSWGAFSQKVQLGGSLATSRLQALESISSQHTSLPFHSQLLPWLSDSFSPQLDYWLPMLGIRLSLATQFPCCLFRADFLTPTFLCLGSYRCVGTISCSVPIYNPLYCPALGSCATSFLLLWFVYLPASRFQRAIDSFPTSLSAPIQLFLILTGLKLPGRVHICLWLSTIANQ